MKNITKIHILFDFKKGPYGGGNQFLKALKNIFIQKGHYEENSARANVILFNSYQNVFKVVVNKLIYPQKIFIHRIDGPILRYRGIDNGIDNIIYKINQHIADGTVFQSKWSQQENYREGLVKSLHEAVIYNAPDPSIFNTKERKPFNSKNKIKLTAFSWSSNWNKGFEYYKYLDDNLDFNRFEMTFIGNSPIKFKNVRMIPSRNSRELAQELKKHDIYITASKNDPCSNSLIEALSCGLPAIALRSGGHPEIVKSGGELFVTKEELIEKIDKVVGAYDSYQKNIAVINLGNISKRYLKFIGSIEEWLMNNKYQLKKIDIFTALRLLILAIFKK